MRTVLLVAYGVPFLGVAWAAGTVLSVVSGEVFKPLLGSA